MQQSALLTVVMPLALAIIMFGLGLSLTLADFRRVAQVPRAVAAGLLVQVVVLPLVAFGLAHLFALPPTLAIGLVLLAASPGGPTANLFSHLAHGDVALNLTLTATNSVLSAVTLPILLGLAMAHFSGENKEIPLQYSKFLQVVGLILIPVAIGMAVQGKKPGLAKTLDKPVRIASALFLLLIIAAAVWAERTRLGSQFAAVGLPALLFNLVSLSVGYLVPVAMKLSVRQAAAISLEIGIHNGTLAIAVAHTVLGDMAYAVPAAVYSLMMYWTAAAFAVWLKRRIDAQGSQEVATLA